MDVVCTKDSESDTDSSSPAKMDSSQRGSLVKRFPIDWIGGKRKSKNSKRKSILRDEAVSSRTSHHKHQGTLPNQDLNSTTTTLPSATLEETIRSADSALQASDPVAQDTRLLTIAEQEYVIISSNIELFQVPVNSEEHRSAAGPENHDIFQTSTSPSTRIEDMMESLSEAEWDDTKSLSLGELVEFF